jgi:hypothetical protein
LTNVAVMVVELVPSAMSDSSPVASVMPPISTIATPAGGGVGLGGVVLGGVVLAGGVPAVPPVPPPPPAFSQPVNIAIDTRPKDTSSQPHACHRRLSCMYRYLLL